LADAHRNVIVLLPPMLMHALLCCQWCPSIWRSTLACLVWCIGGFLYGDLPLSSVPPTDAIFLTTALLLGGWVIWYDHAVEGRPEDTWQGWCAPLSVLQKLPQSACTRLKETAVCWLEYSITSGMSVLLMLVP
jgi:hypothetical protein